MQIAPHARTPRTITGRLPDGAEWIAEVPDRWNGSALLYSHDHNGSQAALKSAPTMLRAGLLKNGYALVASGYPRTAWAIADAVPSQLLALDAFVTHFGKPTSTIAWGFALGGLVTTMIAELYPERIDGALALCSSSIGVVPMMNMALDGAFALTHLLMPSSVIVPITKAQRDEGVVASAVVRLIKNLAQSTKAGRARLALAGVLGGVAGWTTPDHPRPSNTDYWAQQTQIAGAMPEAVFLPRDDQEARAGGAFSWNTGVDYRILLEHSERQDMIESLYRDAGIELRADLAHLNGAPRLSADAAAVTCLQGLTPSGRIGVPVLTMHTIGDGVISPFLQRSYVETVKNAGRPGLIAECWVERAGHCTMTSSEILTGLRALESRLATGIWHVSPTQLNERRASNESRFIEFSAPPMPRATRVRSSEIRPPPST